MKFKQLTLDGNCAHLHYKRDLWNHDWQEHMVGCVDYGATIPISKICRNALDCSVIPI